MRTQNGNALVQLDVDEAREKNKDKFKNDSMKMNTFQQQTMEHYSRKYGISTSHLGTIASLSQVHF